MIETIVPPHPDPVTKKKKSITKKTLDLHGMNLVQACSRCLYFLQANTGVKECLTVICGKGLNSPGIQSVLRSGIEELLVENKAKLKYNYKYQNGAFKIWFD